MPIFSVSPPKSFQVVALFGATLALAACGGAVSSIPAQTARSAPRAGLHENNVQTSVTTCSFPASTKNRLYVANEGASTILRFNPPNPTSQMVNALTPSGIDVKFDHLKNMWVSEWQPNTVYEFAPPYNGAPIGSTYTVLNGSRGIAFDGANRLFIADMADNRVVFIDPPYTDRTGTSISVTNPTSIAFDATCDLWVASNRVSAVEFRPPYTAPPMNTISVPGAYAVALDAKNDLFVGTFAEGYDKVFEYAPPYNDPPIVAVSNGIQGVVGITLDTHGKLFVSNLYTSNITEYKPPYIGPPVLTLTNGLNFQQGLTWGPK